MRATQTALRKFFNGIEPFEGLGLDAAKRDYSWDSVSYTHLTLPTILRV